MTETVLNKRLLVRYCKWQSKAIKKWPPAINISYPSGGGSCSRCVSFRSVELGIDRKSSAIVNFL